MPVRRRRGDLAVPEPWRRRGPRRGESPLRVRTPLEEGPECAPVGDEQAPRVDARLRRRPEDRPGVVPSLRQEETDLDLIDRQGSAVLKVLLQALSEASTRGGCRPVMVIGCLCKLCQPAIRLPRPTAPPRGDETRHLGTWRVNIWQPEGVAEPRSGRRLPGLPTAEVLLDVGRTVNGKGPSVSDATARSAQRRPRRGSRRSPPRSGWRASCTRR